MKHRKRAIVGIAVCLLLVGAQPAAAFFPVIDITNLRQAIVRWQELQRMYFQGRAQLQQVELQYELALSMARYIKDMPQRYRAQFALWSPLAAPDTYGNTRGWLAAENTGSTLEAARGYLAATDPLRVFDPAGFRQLPARTQGRLKNEYATIDLSDGVNANALATIGSIRAHSIAQQQAIAQLQADSTSNNPALNTRAALLNKINVAGVLALRSAQETNQLLAIRAEQAAIRQKQRRDALVRQLNDSIAFQQQFPQTMANFVNDMTRAQESFNYSTSGTQ